MQNKLGITTQDELNDVEERLGKLRAKELYDSGRLGSMVAGTTESLIEIHKAMFGDIYDFAGEFRTVNIYKGDVRFTPAVCVPNAVKLASLMSQDTFEDIIEKYIQMNMVHPFKYGNARATRLWLDVILAAKLGKLVDWNKVNRDAYQKAMEASAKGQREIIDILRKALSNKFDRKSFMHSIDGSFALEGFNKYRAELI